MDPPTVEIRDHNRIVQLQIIFSRSLQLLRVGIPKGGAEGVHRRMQPPVNIPDLPSELDFSRNIMGIFVIEFYSCSIAQHKDQVYVVIYIH